MRIGPGHEAWQHAAGAYVLGALAPGEARAFEAHLAVCPACRAEVEELRPAVEALALDRRARRPRRR